MKRIVRIMYVLLVAGWVLALSGCKTKEKVSEGYTENVRANRAGTKTEMCRDERDERENSTEQLLQTAEKDSLVEKLRERIIVDSCGRILFKDSEYTKEHYQGKGTSKANRNGSNLRTATEQVRKQSQAETGTSGTAVRESTQETAKQTYRWLWFPGLLILLFVSGSIISKVT